MDQHGEGTPATALGGFFALHRHGTPPARAVPLQGLYEGATDPLAARIARVAEKLGTSEPRVAASIAFLGLAARLCSLTLAAAVVESRVPRLPADRLRWDAWGTAPDDLWLDPPPAPAPAPVGPDSPLPRSAELAAGLAGLLYDGHLVPLVGATRRVARVSEGLLWGNAASALAGALHQLAPWCRDRGRPDRAESAHALVTALLAHGRLRGTGTLRGTAFRRRTCCLYYRAPGGGLCGDCVFHDTGRPPHVPPPPPRTAGPAGR